MKTKHMIHSLAAVLLLTACSSDLAPEQTPAIAMPDGGEDLVPVEFSVNSGYSLTRAATSILSFTSGEAVKVCVSKDGGTSYTGYDFTAASTGQSVSLNAPTTGSKPYFPPGDGTTVKAYAYYPAMATAGTFSVADDQTGDASYKASDLMYAADRTITKGSNEGTALSMSHLMAQLAVTVNVQEGSGLSIHHVTVVAKKSVTFAPNTSTLTGVTSDAAGDIKALSGAGTGFVLIPEQPVSGVSIKVATGGGTEAETATYNFTASGNFTAGDSYPITLTVSAQQLGVTSAISDWNGQQSVVIGPTGGLTFSAIGAQTYTGSAIEPSVTVKDGSGTTVPNTGYDLQYSNNTNAGTAVVIAVGKGDYLGKAAVGTFTINKAAGSISYASATVTKTVGDAAFTNALTKTGDGAVTYESSDPSVATVDGNGQVSIAGTGSTTITATVADGANYIYASNTASYSLTVKAAGSVTLSASSSSVTAGSSTSFTVTGNTSGGALTVSVTAGSDRAGATLDGTTVNVTTNGTTAGSATIRVTSAATDTYASAYAEYTLTINSQYTMVSAATASHVGQIICSNGHIHPTVSAINCGGSATAMIVHVGAAGSADASSSTYKGLAIALTDASTSAAWYGTSSAYSSTCVYQNSTFSNHYGYADMAGIANTNQMANKTGNCSGHTTHAAATAAKNYSVAVPAGCSQWFLPTSGQWMRFFRNGTLNLTWSDWGYCTQGATGFTNVNKMFTDAGASSAVFSSGVSCWSSSEYYTDRAGAVYFDSSNGVDVNSSRKYYTYRVRPFLAF